MHAQLESRRQELTRATPDQSVDDVVGDCPKGRVYGLELLGRKKRRYAHLGRGVYAEAVRDDHGRSVPPPSPQEQQQAQTNPADPPQQQDNVDWEIQDWVMGISSLGILMISPWPTPLVSFTSNPSRRRASSKSRRHVHCCCLVGDRSALQRATAPLLHAIHRAAAAAAAADPAGAAVRELLAGVLIPRTTVSVSPAASIPLLARRLHRCATSRGLCIVAAAAHDASSC
ncbi:hypothetical protein Scep_004862 [Stephania cephalantha]|uniref:Uncharacterized protein n=1 Tax=Stephania cephalantha TaxID=152367 RepID=A0AAP0PVT4_9MAGN